MSDLSRRVAVESRREGIDQGLVISEDVELPPFEVVAKMLNGKVYSQQLTIVSAVPPLSRFQGP